MADEVAELKIPEQAEQREQAVDAAAPARDLRLSAQALSNSYALALNGVLQRNDRAYRQNRQLQRFMRHDPDILSALFVRETTIAGLDWSIVADDPEDLKQVAKAKAIERAVRMMRDLRQFLMTMAKAPWYGTVGAAMSYRVADEPIEASAVDETAEMRGDENPPTEAAAVTVFPAAYTPIHSDSIRFTVFGELVLTVSYGGDLKRLGLGDSSRIYTTDGPGVRLTPEQRAAIVTATWNREAADPDEPESAERVYAGNGLRSLLWDAWVRKQHLNQAGDRYAERMGNGTWLSKYLTGGKGKTAAQEMLNALQGDWGITVPIEEGGIETPLELLEPSGQGHQIFTERSRQAASDLRLAILCQTLTTQAEATGLGSGVADAHETTFDKVIQTDAEIIADSLTHELVGPMARANFPGEPCRLRWEFQTETDEEDITELIGQARELTALGVGVPAADLRSKAGFRKPEGDEQVTTGGGGGDFDDLSGRLAGLGI